MKKITFKIIAFLVFILTATQVQAQAFANTVGVYKIRLQSSTLCLTVNATTGAVTYETEISPDSDTQLFSINSHPTADYSITSELAGKGALETLNTTDVTPVLACKGNSAGGSGQHDQWLLSRGAGTQFFLNSADTGTAWEGTSKRRLQDSGDGLAVELAGGTPLKFDYIFISVLDVKENVLESNELTVYPNPSNNGQYKLNIETEWAVYSLLGAELLNGKGKSIDLSVFAKGTYVLKTANSNKVLILK